MESYVLENSHYDNDKFLSMENANQHIDTMGNSGGMKNRICKKTQHGKEKSFCFRSPRTMKMKRKKRGKTHKYKWKLFYDFLLMFFFLNFKTTHVKIL